MRTANLYSSGLRSWLFRTAQWKHRTASEMQVQSRLAREQRANLGQSGEHRRLIERPDRAWPDCYSHYSADLARRTNKFLLEGHGLAHIVNRYLLPAQANSE